MRPIAAAQPIQAPRTPSATISDHAVLRYLERAYGLDVDAVGAEMAAALPGGDRLRGPGGDRPWRQAGAAGRVLLRDGFAEEEAVMGEGLGSSEGIER